MKKIEKYIRHVCEEVEGAMSYAEKYIEFKNSRPQWSRMYHEMAEQELTHAEHLRTIGQGMIDELVFVPEDDMEAWEKCGYQTAEKIAMTRLLLSK